VSKWPIVELREVLRPVSRPEPVRADATYRLLGARWYALGLYVKDVALGSSIQAAKVYRVCEGDFVYNRLFAWKGSFALASQEDDGCFVSNEFPCFRIVPDKLDGHYLWRYFSRLSAWNEALALSTGGTPTSRNRLKEEKLLAMGIPLPPIDEQRRVVARVKEIEARIREARRLRDASSQEVEILRANSGREFFQARHGWRTVELHEVCSTIIDCLHSNPVYADDGIPTVRSPDVGWGRLLLETAKRTGQTEYERRTSRGEPAQDDIILVREGGGTGKAAIVRAGERFSLGQRVMMLRPDTRRVVAKFLLYQWLSPLIYVEQIAERMKGSASPHLNIGALRQFTFQLPPLSEQVRLVEHLDRFHSTVDSVSTIQAKTAVELDAMLPAILDRAFRGEL